MSRHHERDIAPILDAARQWAERCLIEDGSLFDSGELWTSANFELLDRHFVQRPDDGSDKFYEKLDRQMADAPPAVPRLMAELLWVTLLFPSNITPKTKREGIARAWTHSGEALDLHHPMLVGPVLTGIGSAGTAYNNKRWWESLYAVSLFRAIKQMSRNERAAVLTDYEHLSQWLESMPRDGERQFRHMLRYLLCPDQVERMSSNGDRRRVLIGFGVASKREMKNWTDRQFDDAMLSLRRKLESELGTTDLDFYLPPLVDRWKSGDTEGEGDDDGPGGIGEGRDEATAYRPGAAPLAVSAPPLNQILFGPPGTGKTFHLQKLLREHYTEAAATIDPETWRTQQIVTRIATLTWWEALGAALYELGTSATVPELARHPYIIATATAKGRSKGVKQTLWGTLQHHTSTDSKTVNIALRLAPFVFDKDESSNWRLAGAWREHLADVIEVVDTIRQGPKPAGDAVTRYSFVTFHQSFSYEDFIEGLTPTSDEESGNIRYEIKKGAFLRLCERARADPEHPYAMVIDEINRGNVSKVFGELITLIEDDKRAGCENEIEATLPYSGDSFSVPSNVHIVGTMNTADRSLAGLDIALRRRFTFVEMPPRPDLLDGVVIQGINIGRMLARMNQRIEVLLDRDHCLGHAYFMSLSSGDGLDRLAAVFRQQILPLLQEYFFEDWQRIALVLNDHRKTEGLRFVVKKMATARALFGDGVDVPNEASLWHIDPDAFNRPRSYSGIIDAGQE